MDTDFISHIKVQTSGTVPMDHTKLTAIDDADAYTNCAGLLTYSELADIADKLLSIAVWHVHGAASADRYQIERCAALLKTINGRKAK